MKPEPSYTDLITEREKIIAICQQHCDSRTNTKCHGLAYKILVLMGEREEETK